MKIEDRIQALMRSKKYKTDYDRYSIEKGDHIDGHIAGEYIFPLSPQAQKLCNKYKIPFPVIPREEVEYIPPLSPENEHVTPFAPAIVMLREGINIGPEEDGYMTIRIRIASPISDIQKAIKQLYNAVAKPYTTKAHRARESGLDIWKVYDMKGSGLNASQIAKCLAGSKDNPSCNSQVMNWYKSVRAAIKKAESIMTAVEA